MLSLASSCFFGVGVEREDLRLLFSSKSPLLAHSFRFRSRTFSFSTLPRPGKLTVPSRAPPGAQRRPRTRRVRVPREAFASSAAAWSKVVFFPTRRRLSQRVLSLLLLSFSVCFFLDGRGRETSCEMSRTVEGANSGRRNDEREERERERGREREREERMRARSRF